MKIVFTGGHHNSALVVARLLRKKGHQIFWFGHKHTMEKEKSLSAEYLEVRRYGFPFFEIKTGKFYRTYNPLQYFKIVFGFFQALILLLRFRPNLIVSFGGYLAVPVVFAGFLLRIPSFIHEQTTQAGLANQITSFLAKKIFITWPSSIRFFPKKKTELIGLPLRKSFFKKNKTKLFKNNLPTIFVVGGKQGSHFINKLIEESLVEILKEYNLIHQAGRIKRTGDLARLRKKRKALPPELKKRYLLKPYFFDEEMTTYLPAADLVISRAGAHIIYELAVLGKPAVLIPYPWSYKNEQLKNAQVLEKLGMAKILSQKQANSLILIKTIKNCFKELEKLEKNPPAGGQRLIKKDAAEKMVSFIEKTN